MIRCKAWNGSAALWRLLLCGIFLGTSGCAVGPAGEALIETECRAHDADLNEWHDLTPAERRESYEDSRAGVYEIRHAVLGTPLPPDLQAQHDREASS